MFNTILVANRGEIAIRAMRACHEMGIKTVAVYSEADKHALFAKYADVAHCIGPPPTSQSYLRIDKILDVAEKTGAEAIHPGYGFLSENSVFARECEKMGIVFIGPSSKSMEASGSKIAARKAMEKAGIPIIPGISAGIDDPESTLDDAEKIGYPVIVKASAGGGGIGMKIANNASELRGAIDSTRAVAESVFGDATIFMEKYLHQPRHIEFQILADSRGNTIHLNERECSIQRRHQKLIEESPSPVMTPELREEMGRTAIEAAEAFDYTNAGTVEFIYSDGDFYFLEMNTRLQVEHPITEAVTGVDLAREQLRVASGLELEYGQEDIQPRGHAIECRINAEDPLNDFMPAPSKIVRYAEPSGPGIRIDSGVYQGFTIPPFYDSMIAKLIIWAEDRPRAIERTKRALWEFQIGGVRHNIPFHQVVMNNQQFISGDYTTSFIPRYKILDQVIEHVKATKAQSSTPRTAAAMAAVQAVIMAANNSKK